MRFASLIAQQLTSLRRFRTAVDRERETWTDTRFGRLHDDVLMPLIAENERYNRELQGVAAATQAANRRLEDSR